MRISRMVLVIALIAGLTGCSCWKKKVGPADGNIPVAAEGDILKDIGFDFDRYSIGQSAKAVLAASAEWLKANAAAKVKIEGHCDERGTEEYNMVLGQHRAQAAKDYLRSLGIEADRMSTISYGKALPLDPAHNEAAWSKNRRAHFVVQQ
jgi:peptidoglycan-associated lipoprotein